MVSTVFEVSMIHRVVFIVVFLISVVACNSPMERPYRQESIDRDLKDMVSSGALDSSEASQLGLYISTNKGEKTSTEDLTYSQLWEDAKGYQREAKRVEELWKKKEEQVRQEQAFNAKRLQESISLNLYGKGHEKEGYQEYLTFDMSIENHASKDIRAFRGRIVFKDLFDQEIIIVTLRCDRSIPAGQSIRWKERSSYHDFVEGDRLLREKDLDHLKILWEPEKIIFTDNSTL